MEDLRKVRWGVVALIMLGFCELLAIDISANYLIIYSIAGSGFLIFATLFIGIFSAGVMCLMVLRLWLEMGAHYLGAAKAGAFVGFFAGLGVCVVEAVASAAGFGVSRLLPYATIHQGQMAIGIAYGAILLATMLLYIAGGALTGIFAALAIPEIEAAEREEKNGRKLIHVS